MRFESHIINREDQVLSQEIYSTNTKNFITMSSNEQQQPGLVGSHAQYVKGAAEVRHSKAT